MSRRLTYEAPIEPITVLGHGAWSSTDRLRQYTVDKIVATIDARGEIGVSYRGKSSTGRALSCPIQSQSLTLRPLREDVETRLRRAWMALS